MNTNFMGQFKEYGRIILITVLIFNVILLVTWGIAAVYALPIEYLLEDPASLLGYNQFIGFLTPIGVVVLAAGIGAVLLAASMNKEGWDETQRRILRSLYFLAAVSLFLLLDDLFLLHERVFTGLFRVGEHTIFLTYVLLFVLFAAIHHKAILNGPTLFLVLAFLLFGVSLASDFVTDKVSFGAATTSTLKMLEEAGKLGGYLFWTAYIMMRAKGLLGGEAA
ncbi:MAG: hypothetical protein PWQ55_99 [Chloroflexota bacterium]|nr:hypothetical protein [Chloroflexota bacterium]